MRFMANVVDVVGAALPTYGKWPVAHEETGTIAPNEWLLSGARTANLKVRISA